MAQPVSVLIYPLLCSGWHRPFLIMLGCMLLVTASFAGTGEQVRRFEHNKDGKPDQWEYFTPGSQEPYNVERDTSGDGQIDAAWEQGTSASGKPP